MLDNAFGTFGSFNAVSAASQQATMPQAPSTPIAVSEIDQRLARAALPRLESWLLKEDMTFDLPSEDGEGHKVEIPTRISALFLEALRQTAAGKAVSIVEVESELTTQQAAAVLKVSRPIVVSLVEGGHLAARKVGNRLRLPVQDVLDYKAANSPKRRAPSIIQNSSDK